MTSDREPSRRWSAPLEPGQGATITGLPPAFYHVTVVSASGSGRPSVDVSLAAGEIVSVAVTIVSQGAAAWRLEIVDRTWKRRGTHIDAGELDTMALGSGLSGLFDSAAPFVIADRRDTGGLNLGDNDRIAGRGASWTTSASYLGGLRLLESPISRQSVATFPDLDAFEAVIVSTGGATPDVASPGSTVTLVPRRPGPLSLGAFDVSFTAPGMVSENDGDAPSIERLDTWKGVGAQYGGPMSPRTGLFVSADAFGMRERERDRPATLSSNVSSVQGHLVSNLADRTQVRLLGRAERAKHPYAPLRFLGPAVPERDLFLSLEASGEHQTQAGARLGAAVAIQHAGVTPDPGDLPEVTMDRVTDGIVPQPIQDVGAARTEIKFEFAAPEIRRHALEAGAILARVSSTSHVLAAPPVAELVAGIPARFWVPTLPLLDSHRTVGHFALYVNDRIHARPNLTLDAGVRLQLSRGSAQGVSDTFPWRAALPRVSIRWAPRLLTVYGGYGRYQDELPLALLAFGDPGEPVARVYRWDDANGNARFDQGELGAIVAMAGRGPAVASADPSLRSPHTDEVTFGAERRFGGRMLVGVTGTIRRTHSLVRSVDVGVPVTSYVTRSVLDQGTDYEGSADDRLLAIYDRTPESFGLDRFLLTNVTGDTASYEGLEFVWKWTGVRWWSEGGASALRSEAAGGNRGFRSEENDQGVIGELFEDPNAQTNARGRLFFDRGYALKWTTGVRAPHDLRFGATARYEDGQPFARLVIAPDLAQGPEIVQAYANGRTRFTFIATIDARVEKWFAVGDRRAALRLEVFNLTNLGNEVEENPVTGPDFRRTTAVQPPRAVRVGFHVEF